MSKILIAISFIFLLANTACNSSGGNGAAPRGGLTTDTVAGDLNKKLSSRGRLAASGDTKTMIYLRTEISSNNLKCIYWLTEKTTVDNVTTADLDLSFDRSVQAFATNAADCPLQTTNFIAHDAKHWALSEYLMNKNKALHDNIDTERFANLPWVASVVITRSEEQKHDGLNSQLVEIDVTDKKGTHCIYSQYFSLDSIFMGRFEETRMCGSFSLDQYQRLVDFSIQGLSKN